MTSCISVNFRQIEKRKNTCLIIFQDLLFEAKCSLVEDGEELVSEVVEEGEDHHFSNNECSIDPTTRCYSQNTFSTSQEINSYK